MGFRKAWGNSRPPLAYNWRFDMSIIRVGLAETKKFAAGYDAIFGKRKKVAPSARLSKPAKKAAGKKAKKRSK